MILIVVMREWENDNDGGDYNEGEEDVVLNNARGRMSRLDQDFHRQAGSCPMEM